MHPKLLAYPAIAVFTLLLTGCDAAENAANKVIETSKDQLVEAARDTFSESAKQINETIDKAQESAKPWMKDDEQKAETQQSSAEQRAEDKEKSAG